MHQYLLAFNIKYLFICNHFRRSLKLFKKDPSDLAAESTAERNR